MSTEFTNFVPYVAEKDEEYMNEKQKAHFRSILEGKRLEIVQESERTVAHMQDGPINMPDLNDRASQEEEFSLELRARDRERKLLAKIESTLRKIALDEYGYCEQCGVEIGIKRLEARPTAFLCIDCKEIAEKKEKTSAQ